MTDRAGSTTQCGEHDDQQHPGEQRRFRADADPTDGRVSLFEIAKLGLEQLQSTTMQARHERFTRILENWTPEEREMFGELLAQLNRTFLD